MREVPYRWVYSLSLTRLYWGMTLCYYVTGHGYGHAIRTAQILKALPPTLPIILKTAAPETLFREELAGREFEYVYGEYDCGCVQRDSVTILKRQTLDLYREISNRNALLVRDEVQFLRTRGVRLVASDIAPFPLAAAQEAQIPGVAVTNFTWYDIYKEYVETADDHELLKEIADQYRTASLALLWELHPPSTPSVFERIEYVPLATRRGVRVREALNRHMFNTAAVQRSATYLGLIYVGTWGLDVAWRELEKLTDWRFLTYEPVPNPPQNLVVIDRKEWRYADVVASVDTIVSKVGYGTVSDCIANSVPQIHLPRKDFAEYAALVAGMDRWGGRVEMSEQDFVAGRWADALHKSLHLRMDPGGFRTDGADVIAKRLMELMDSEGQ